MKSRFAAALAALLVSPAWGWAGPTPAGFAERLAAMVAGGEVSRDEADLYRLYAVRAPERLPPGLRGDGRLAGRGERAVAEPRSPGLRCGTPVLRRVRARLDRLPPELRAEAEALLDDRPTAGRAAFRSGAGKTGTAVLANRLVTENFSIEWGQDLTDEDGSTPPSDAGPTDASDPAVGGNGIPDVVERWAAYFEAAYAEEVEGMGYTHPVVEGNLIPVYIGNSDPSRSLENIGSGTYAFTQPDGVPYIVVNNDLSFVPPNDEGASGLSKIHGAMKITAAHELFHVFHFLYEPAAWNPTEDDWWFECSSTWMEDEVFDDVNDYYQYFGPAGQGGWADFLDEGLPVSSGDADYVTRAYGSVIFAKYLSEHVGGRAALYDVWQEILDGSRALEALDAFARARGFEGLPDLFLGFVGATAVMDYEEGDRYGGVPVFTGLDALSFSGLGYLGARYRSENVVAGVTTLSYPTPTDSGWGIVVAYRDPDTGQYVYQWSTAVDGSVTLSVEPTATVELVVGAARLTPDPVPESPTATAAAGGAGGGCFLIILGR